MYFAPSKIAPDRSLLNWPRNSPQILPWITCRGTPSKTGDKTHASTGVDSSHPERQPTPGQRARYGGGHRGEITPQNASYRDPFHGQDRDPLRACPTPGSHNLRDCGPVGPPPQRPSFPWRPHHPPRSACPTQQRLAQRRACITYRTRACRPFARDTRLHMDAAQDVDRSGGLRLAQRRALTTYGTAGLPAFRPSDPASSGGRSIDALCLPNRKKACPTGELAPATGLQACRPSVPATRLDVDAAQHADPSGGIEASLRPRPLDWTLAPGAP